MTYRPITSDRATQLAQQDHSPTRTPDVRIPTGQLTIAARLAASMVRIPTPPLAARVIVPAS